MTLLKRSNAFKLGSFEFELQPKPLSDLHPSDFHPYYTRPLGRSSACYAQCAFKQDIWTRETIYDPFDFEELGSSALSRHASVHVGSRRLSKRSGRHDSAGESGIGLEESKTQTDSPPDGGFIAWLQVLVSFLLVFNGFGYINAFGVFQATYAESTGQSLSSISFIGSFQIFLLFFVGTLSGRALDAGFFLSLLRCGCAMQVSGIFATASATKYWQLFLAQGLLQGIGNGMLFTPLVWVVSIYFTKKRGLALGLASCGAPVGGIVFPLLARQLITQIGFAWTVRVMGFVVLFNSAIIVLCAKPRATKRAKAPLLDFAAFQEIPFLFYSIGIFFALWGLYWAPIYITIYVKKVLQASSQSSLMVLMILNGTGITGRLIPPAIADRVFGPLVILTFCTLLSATFLYIWIAVSSLSGLIAWSILYAFWSNAVQTLFTATVGALTADFRRLGVRIGMVFTIISIASLTGPPLAGVLVQLGNGSFVYAQIFGGTSMLIGFGAMAVACYFQSRDRRGVAELAD